MNKKIVISEEFLKAVASKQGVSDAELGVLSLVVQRYPIPDIAKKLGISEDLVRKRLSDMYKKFDTPGRGPVKRGNLEQQLRDLYEARQQKKPGLAPPPPDSQISPERRRDWGEAPDVSIFYGRSGELNTLEQWIVKEGCRVAAILGMGGMGKTSLSVKLAKEIEANFDWVIWRSLRQAPPVKEILGSVLEFISPNTIAYLPEDVGDRISQLIDLLQARRCLLVLDSAEAILQPGELAGRYAEGYEDYKELIERVATEPHQSCLVVTSLEQIEDIALLEGKTLPVRALNLRDLQDGDAWEIFRSKGLLEEQSWPELTKLYGGNPLVLKIVATTIKELFGGKVVEFLKHKSFVFGNIRELLDFQFARLSEFEQEILYWLAIEGQPISYLTLQDKLAASLSETGLMEALESLRRRALIERSTEAEEITRFGLQPVVMEYITGQLISQVSKEIVSIWKTQKLDSAILLRSHALVKGSASDADTKLRERQIILMPILERLRKAFRSPEKVQERLQKILSLLEGQPESDIGYTKRNLEDMAASLQANFASKG